MASDADWPAPVARPKASTQATTVADPVWAS